MELPNIGRKMPYLALWVSRKLSLVDGQTPHKGSNYLDTNENTLDVTLIVMERLPCLHGDWTWFVKVLLFLVGS